MDLGLTVKALEAVSLSANDDTRPGFDVVFAEIRSRLPAENASETGNTGVQSDNHAIDLSLPVGLGNLRNTCYLNSILQYFYSVKAVRDLALNSQQPELEPTDQSLQALLEGIAPSDLEPGRAFVGAECKIIFSLLSHFPKSRSC